MPSTSSQKSSKDSKHMQPATSAQSKNGGKPAPAVETKGGAKPAESRVFTDEPATGTTAKAEPVEAAPVPQLSAEEKRRYFDAVLAAEAEIKAAEQRVKDARQACSTEVKKLIAAMGGKHGPWRYKGELLRARVRNDLAYFLRPDDLDVEDI